MTITGEHGPDAQNGKLTMNAEYLSRDYLSERTAMREAQLRDPDYWEANARIQTHPDFKRAALNYAKILRDGKMA